MNTRLADLRNTLTPAAADLLLEEYARLAAQKASLEARLERRIVELKSAEQPKLANLDAAMQPIAAAISSYIAAHREAFESPRTRKTSFGEYGLRQVTSLDVDPVSLLSLCAAVKARGDLTDCYRESISLVRPAILTRIQTDSTDAAWFRAHGATDKTGDTIVLKVAKAVIDTARNTES